MVPGASSSLPPLPGTVVALVMFVEALNVECFVTGNVSALSAWLKTIGAVTMIAAIIGARAICMNV